MNWGETQSNIRISLTPSTLRATIVTSKPVGAMAQLANNSIARCQRISFRLDEVYLPANAKKTMNPARLLFNSMRGSQGSVRMIDGSMIHSAPYLSAKAPTIGPQKNVGAAAATDETAVNYTGKHPLSRTYDRQDRQNRHSYSKHFGRAKSICP